jgi:anti-anti-sigma regulatory factor
MLKITAIQRNDGSAELRVEGRVTHQTLEALRASCDMGVADHQTMLLDLSGVLFVDAAGVALLRSLAQRGAVLIDCSGFLTELLH